MNELFLQCACKGEGLKLEYYKEEPNDGIIGFPDELWISLWSLGFGDSRKPSIWRRLQLAFHLLKKGTLHTDMIILHKDNILELKKWLDTSIEESNEEKV